jgi:hypothetical protein
MEIRQEVEPVNQKLQEEGKETSQILQPAILDDHTDMAVTEIAGSNSPQQINQAIQQQGK